MFREDGGEVVTMDAAPNPFKDATDINEAMFYISDIPPITQSASAMAQTWTSCKLTRQGYAFC